MAYNDGANSTVDAAAGNAQIRQEYYDRKAIIDVKDDMYLSPLSGTMSQPKGYGKEVVKHRYLPLLSDENSVANSGIDPDGVTLNDGNLYASSRSIGVINGKLPDLSENAERENKVNFSRKEVRGSIKNRGFFYEYTKDEMNFDTDRQLKQHLTTEAVRGAVQINEDVLAIELVDKAGVVFNAGSGQDLTLDGTNIDDSDLASIDNTSVPTIQDLIRIDTELDNNKCPRDTKVISGSTFVDTKTVASARYMFISPDAKMDFMSIKKLNGVDDAFVPVEQYANATGDSKYIKSIHGEIGAVGPFRIVVHPKMVMQEGAGAGTPDAAFRNDGTNYNVYPCLVVGSGAFTHIGFEFGAGTAGKFKVVHKDPESLRTRENTFAKFGMTVIEWWNGVLVERPDWVAVYNIAAKY